MLQFSHSFKPFFCIRCNTVFPIRCLSNVSKFSVHNRPSIKSDILTTNRHLLPKLSFTSQFNDTIIRSFGTSKSILDYYRGPKSTVMGAGTIGRLWSRIPDSVKLIGAVGISACFVIFVAVPVFVVVVPPLIFGSWLFIRLNRYMKEKQMKKRWESIADSTLLYYPPKSGNEFIVPPPDQINSSLGNFEINRIVDAFWNNEQGINDYFKIDNVDNLGLGTLDAVQYSYNSTSVVFADDFSMMVTQQRSLYNKSTSKEIANVIMSLKCLDRPIYEDVDPSANIGRSLVAIEIIPSQLFSKTFVLKTPSESTDHPDLDEENDDGDGFINVKGKTTIL